MKNIDIFSYPWIVLSIDKNKKERLDSIFEHYGLKKPTTFDGFQMSDLNGYQNNMLGHLGIIKMAKLLDLPGIVVFEDDAYPCKDIKESLSSIKEVPDDLKILTLGWIQNNNRSIGKFTNFRFGPLYGTHSYVILKDGYDIWLNYFSSTNLNADWLFTNCKNKEIYFYEKCLFIQYNDGLNVGCQTGYRYNNGCGHNAPPIGYEEIKAILP